MDTLTRLAAAVECIENLGGACPHLAPALRSRLRQAARLVDEGRLADVDALAEIRVARAVLTLAPRLPAVRALPSERIRSTLYGG